MFRIQANNSVMCGCFCSGFIDFVLSGETFIDYTSWFSPNGFLKTDNIIFLYCYFKNEWMKSIKTTNMYSNLTDQTKFRLTEINKIEYYFNSEIYERKVMSKKLNKYIAAFHYFDKTLIALYAISGGIYIIFLTSVIGVPVGIESVSLVFSLTTRIIRNWWWKQ